MSFTRSKRHALSSAVSGKPSTSSFFQALGFTFGKTIGQGTYSKVCTVTNEAGKVLACKIINKKCAGIEFIDKFLPRELGIICSIKHPNIVTVHKVLEVNSIIYMFMDFCKNGDLLEFIRLKGALSEDKAKWIFRQIVDAVQYLHNLDVAHRDLKCENVFLMGDNRVKLGDFGFARHCKNHYGEKIKSSTFCGSAAYAAPEILQGVLYEPKKYDIWSLGCILYIMLAASMPFDDANIKKMVKAQLTGIINDAIAKWPKQSDAVKVLISCLLEPDSTQRVTIEDVADCAWLEEEVSKRQKVLSKIF
ncbi:unnamed protein product [Brassicogethes aeneus]|uniref:Protein kinase domain-containing protein n=1 Tax=Brassicogethes aeneus TaxID=1431903 RepID=A0A9P0FG30_BRAAE|nr:unnamed protein product [Brassicogethes aeneus]